MESLDQGFLSSLLHQSNLNLVSTYKIRTKMLVGPHKKLFGKILAHFEEYGTMPRTDALKRFDSDFKASKLSALEPFEYYCTELQKRSTFNLVRKTFEKGSETLQQDPVGTVDLLRKMLGKVNTEFTASSDVEVSEDVDSRKQAYLDAKAGLSMGIPFPWETLNEASMGIQSEDLVSIVADSGVGKTWALIDIASYAYTLGFHVLFFTREMSREQILRRFDAKHGRFAYDQLRRGRLGTKEETRFFQYLDDLSENTNQFYVSGDDTFEEKMGLDLVASKIDQYQALLPDPEKLLVIVDGAYFLAPEENGDDGMDWKVIAKVTQGLKRMARKKKVPMVITSQAKRGTKKKVTPDQSDVGFGYSIVQDSNILILMNQTDEQRVAKTMKFWTAKIRDSAPVAWTCNWCMDTMDFSEFGRGHGIDTGSYKPDQEDGEERPDSDYIMVEVEEGGAGAYGGYTTRERRLKPGRRKAPNSKRHVQVKSAMDGYDDDEITVEVTYG